MVISPFAAGHPFEVNPADWSPGKKITCPHSQQTVRLPDSLPEWKPVGSMQPGHPGIVLSPFGKKSPMKVRAADWEAGASVTCLETGYSFRLPTDLPPLTGTVANGNPGHAMSPYVPGLDVSVTRNEWVPGGSVKCSKTGRPFLLPQSLPPWPGKPIPWALAAIMVAAIAAVLSVIFVGSLKRGAIPKGAPTPKVADEQTTRVVQAAEVPATLSGGLRIPDWTRDGSPNGLIWSYQGQHGSPKVEKVGDRVYKLDFELPALAGKETACEVQISMPGWKTLTVTLLRNGSGAFINTSREILLRQTASVPVEIPQGTCDYDTLTAVWKDHLLDEPQATPPAQGSVSVNVAPGTEPIPTGIYEIKLVSRNPAIRPVQYGEIELTTRGIVEPLRLPPSIKGDYWGPVYFDSAGQAYFLVLSADAKLGFLETRLLQFPKGTTVFRYQDAKPFVGDIWNVKAGAWLENKGKDNYLLRFSAPVLGVRVDWSFSNTGGGRYLLEPVLAREGGDVEALSRYSLEHLQDQVSKIRVAGRVKSADDYAAADLDSLFANGDARQLQRFKDLSSPAAIQAVLDNLRSWIASHPGGGFTMYPIGTLVRKVGGGDWDLVPAPDR